MHPILVINLILTICLCDKNSLHNSILYIITNVLALTTDYTCRQTSKAIGIAGKSEAEPHEIL